MWLSSTSTRSTATRPYRKSASRAAARCSAKCDVANSKEVQAAIQAGVAKWGRIDVVVNDAAMMTFKPIVDLPEEDFDKVLAVNLRSVFLFCKYAIPHMPTGRRDRQHQLGSRARNDAERGPICGVARAEWKRSPAASARSWRGRKIRVNCVAPGAVNTPMLWNNPNVKSGDEKVKGAVGKPEDIAAAICFLASDEARFVTWHDVGRRRRPARYSSVERAHGRNSCSPPGSRTAIPTIEWKTARPCASTRWRSAGITSAGRRISTW